MYELAFRNIREMIQGQAERYGDKTFLIFPEREQEISYRQMADMCARTANFLQSLGVGKGDKVAILLPNIPEFLYFYWGCMLIGAVAGPVNTLLKGPEIQFITDNCEAKVFVTSREFIGEMNAITGELPQVKHYVWLMTHSLTRITATKHSSLNLASWSMISSTKLIRTRPTYLPQSLSRIRKP